MLRIFERLTGHKRAYEIDIQIDNQKCIVRFEGEYKGEVLPLPVGIQYSADDLYAIACANISDLVGLSE